MRCQAGERCFTPDVSVERYVDEQYDGIGIYAGLWHEKCWDRFGYANYTREDAIANGERIDEEW